LRWTELREPRAGVTAFPPRSRSRNSVACRQQKDWQAPPVPGCNSHLKDWRAAKPLCTGERIAWNPKIFGGKPIIRGRRLAVEHVLGVLAAGDDADTVLSGYPRLKREDILACLAYARRIVGHERIEPLRPAE
jgi:uncharacterized protein (DUF433 family)